MLLLDGEAQDAMFTTTVTVEAGRAAGIGLRLDTHGRGLAVILDAHAGTVGVVELESASTPATAATLATGVVWQTLAERMAPVRPGVPVPLRIVVARSVVDVFIAEELMLSVVAEGHGAGRFALIASEARVRFDSMRAMRLALPAPVMGTVSGAAAGVV